MSTLTKLFNFNSNSEGWTAEPGDGSKVFMRWAIGKHSTNRDINPILIDAPGALMLTARGGGDGYGNDWTLVGTPESMGVPVGSVITGIDGSFLARWMFKTRGKNVLSSLSLGGDDFNAGPLQLFNGASYIGNIAAELSGPYRDGVNDPYRYYPTASPPDNPVTEESSAFVKSTGSHTGLSIPSSTSLTYKLHINTPFTDPSEYNNGQWGQVKIDRVQLVFTYTSGFNQPPMGFYGAF